MKTKLPFLLLLLLLSVKGFAQATAYDVPSLTQCNNEVFNLTVQVMPALGNQSPATHSVSFYLTQTAANSGTNPITMPQSYVAPQNGIVFYRVTNTSNGTFDVNFFNISWGFTPQISQPANITVCNSYILPALAVGNYMSGPGGTGVTLPAGTAITSTQLIYVYAQSGSCIAEASFMVTVFPAPQTNEPSPYVVCTDDTGINVFDLTSKIPEILPGGLNGLMVSFYETLADATGGGLTNQITDPSLYTTPALTQTIFVRVEGQGSMCFEIVTLELVSQLCTDNLISGTIRFDFNNQGCTPNSQPAPGIGVYSITGSNSYQTFTNANGQYTFPNLQDGTHVVTVVAPDLQYNLTPSAHTVVFPGSSTIQSDFCMGVSNVVNDVSVSLVPVTQSRPGFQATYAIIYKNHGNVPSNGTINFVFQGQLMTIAGTQPVMNQLGNLLSFAYTNLMPMQTRTIYVYATIAPPPTVNGGDQLILVATIAPNGNDANGNNNSAVLTETVVNSFDPNDILVREGAFITLPQAQSEYLHYTIRFQNIGTADAINVRIENTLDANLDWSTFQPVAASHAYRVLRLNNEVEFYYDNINLPGSNDEPNSHGFITYRIKPKTGIALGDVMQNSAAIYFDFNQPILTNTVTTTVGTLGIPDVAKDIFALYPNPANSYVTVKMHDAAAAEITITDVTGKTVLKTSLDAAESNIDIAALHSGMYFITLSAEGKSSTKKLIVK